MNATKQNQSILRLLSNQSNGNRLPLWKLEMKVKVGGLELCVTIAALAWVRDEQALSWTELPKQQHSACCRPTCKPIRERKFVFVFFCVEKRVIVQRKKCRLTVGLSRISSISKDERAANLTSAPGGQRSRYATGYMHTCVFWPHGLLATAELLVTLVLCEFWDCLLGVRKDMITTTTAMISYYRK